MIVWCEAAEPGGFAETRIRMAMRYKYGLLRGRILRLTGMKRIIALREPEV